jgi:hypothetical protein
LADTASAHSRHKSAINSPLGSTVRAISCTAGHPGSAQTASSPKSIARRRASTRHVISSSDAFRLRPSAVDSFRKRARRRRCLRRVEWDSIGSSAARTPILGVICRASATCRWRHGVGRSAVT